MLGLVTYANQIDEKAIEVWCNNDEWRMLGEYLKTKKEKNWKKLLEIKFIGNPNWKIYWKEISEESLAKNKNKSKEPPKQLQNTKFGVTPSTINASVTQYYNSARRHIVDKGLWL